MLVVNDLALDKHPMLIHVLDGLAVLEANLS